MKEAKLIVENLRTDIQKLEVLQNHNRVLLQNADPKYIIRRFIRNTPDITAVLKNIQDLQANLTTPIKSDVLLLPRVRAENSTAVVPYNSNNPQQR